MIFWRRTRSSDSLRRCGKMRAGEYFCPRRGRPSIIGLDTPASFSNSFWEDLSPVEWLLRKMGENLYMQNADLAGEPGIGRSGRTLGHATASMIKTANIFPACFWNRKAPGSYAEPGSSTE